MPGCKGLLGDCGLVRRNNLSKTYRLSLLERLQSSDDCRCGLGLAGRGADITGWAVVSVRDGNMVRWGLGEVADLETRVGSNKKGLEDNSSTRGLDGVPTGAWTATGCPAGITATG